MGKKFWASKTLWINFIAVVAAILAATGVYDLDATAQAEIVAAVMAVVNIVLRFVTKEPVSVK